MYIALLRFTNERAQAGEFMTAHKAWLERGIADGVFLVVGSLQPQLGGALIAHATTRAELETRLQEDPFVTHGIVSAELLEVTPSKTDPRLAFLIR